MGPIGYPETSVKNYHYTLSDNPEDRRSHNMTQFCRELSSVFFCSHPFHYFFPITHSLGVSVRKSTCVHLFSLRTDLILSTHNIRQEYQMISFIQDCRLNSFLHLPQLLMPACDLSRLTQ